MKTLILLAATLLASASARAADFTQLPWTTQGCVSVTPATLTLGTCLGGACGNNVSVAEAVAPLPGNYQVTLDASITAANPFTNLFVIAGNQVVYQHGDAPWCQPAPCAQTAADLAFHVDAGDTISIRLEAIELGCGTGGTQCVFSKLRFKADTGFFSKGPGLDGSIIHGGAGAHAGDAAGHGVALLGDLDGDLVPDFAIGTPGEAVSGIVRVRSGAHGAVLLTLSGNTPFEHFGAAIAALGDASGDGVPDLVIGAPDDDEHGPDFGSARLISGANGATLRTFFGLSAVEHFGAAVAGCGDVDGDGLADVAVGAPNRASVVAGSGAGAAAVYSGATGQLLHTEVGTLAGEQFGVALASVADLDGDGARDLVIGAPGEGPSIATSIPGSVRLVSGATGATLHTFLGDAIDDKFGAAVADAGDVDGDGQGDILVGAPQDVFQGVFDGYARVLSGATLAPLFTATGAPDEALGHAVAGVGDVDGDGRDDIALGGPRAQLDTGVIRVLTAMGATEWLTITGSEPDAWIGERLAAGRAAGGRLAGSDLDGDGVPDLLAGAEHANLPLVFQGQWQVFAGSPALHGPPVLSGAGPLTAGSTVSFTVHDAASLALSTLVLGLSELDAPFKGGVLVPHPDVLLAGLVTDASGSLVLQATWPSGVPAALPFWVQVWIVDPRGPHGLTASNGLLVLTP